MNLSAIFNSKTAQYTIFAAGLAVLTFMPEMVMAQTGAAASTTTSTPPADGLGKMASDATTQISAFKSLIITIASVAGIGFILAGLLGFKAHKESPQQYPLSKAIVLLAVGAALSGISVIQTKTAETVGLTSKDLGE